MKFGTGSNTERTQKYTRVKVQNDIHTSKYINKQTSPIFNCITPVSVSLAPLARQLLLLYYHSIIIIASKSPAAQWRFSLMF